ncbi:MAG: hypothetical protein ACHREM_16935 [Polyangiales bacterium]
MNRATCTTTWRRLACTVSVGATAMMLMANTGCGVAVGAEYPSYGEYPPDEYLVTTEPIYFEGHAAYWYGGRWNYREGGRWNHYDREPPALQRRRSEAPPRRRTYEPPRARPAAPSSGRHGGHR